MSIILVIVHLDLLGDLGNDSKVTDKGNLKPDIKGSGEGPSIGDQTIQAASHSLCNLVQTVWTSLSGPGR